MTFSYLASPYSHDEEDVREDRYVAARDCLDWLLLGRHWTYSPIVHCHGLCLQWPTATHARDYNFALLRQARDLLVLCIDGWDESSGVAEEVAFAHAMHLPVFYLTPAKDFGYDFDTKPPRLAKIPVGRALGR